jgi:limonene 1,2-monooxygenase
MHAKPELDRRDARVKAPLRFGTFIAPYHLRIENPTTALERDLELISLLDRIGYDEAWIGEHHSGGGEIIAAPELFIAVAAERTKHLRLGTGVMSLPYHSPYILADRMVLLDHLTRGRAMLGVGPGALVSDSHMMNLKPSEQRRMMGEALDAIIRLFTSEEPVTVKTDWFAIEDAQLQLRPYSHPHMEIAVASSVSPAGAQAAGAHGVGLLNMSATSPRGVEALASQWKIAQEVAAENNLTMDRRKWRLVGPMHIAETRERARADVAYGLKTWVEYFRTIATVPLSGDAATADDMVDSLNTSGLAVIGTPDDAIAQINRLLDASGGFGTYLIMAHDWADPAATVKSYELFAQYVMPAFRGSWDWIHRSRNWVMENVDDFRSASLSAREQATAEYARQHSSPKPSEE